MCGPHEASHWRRERPFGVVRCRGCGLGITWPSPSEEDLARYYAPGYYERDHMGADAALGWRERADQILARIDAPIASVLDVGSGQGHLVAALRARGLRAEGIEPLASGRRAARDLHDVELLESWPAVGADSFDLITVVHALEHVRDPLALLQAAAQRVTPGGLLFVDVPHAASVELWRRRWRREILSLPGHLFHFTPVSLGALLRRAGWRVTDVHVINPEILEWAFAARARFTRRAAATPSAASARSHGPIERPLTPEPRGVLSRMWNRTLLPWMRDRFPGYRFEVVAVRDSARPAGGSA